MCCFSRVLLDREMSKNETVINFCKQLYDNHCRSPFLLAFLIDVAEEKLKLGTPEKESVLKNALEVSNPMLCSGAC